MKPMRALMLMCVLGLALDAGRAWAQKPRGKAPTKTSDKTSEAVKKAPAPPAASSEDSETTSGGKKVKVLTFGTMDLEGRLRTPQLLYFLNRVKSELESTSQQRRSFMKELQDTGTEKGL